MAEARQPSRRVALAERGSVTFPKAWVFDYVRDGILWPSHLALLLYIAAVFENGQLPIASNAVTFDGSEIVLDTRKADGILPDPEGSYEGEVRLLAHLELNGFVEVERLRGIVKIRLGAELKNIQRAA